jgi:peptidoglycan/LPS O-acetylase OafA/YrhL
VNNAFFNNPSNSAHVIAYRSDIDGLRALAVTLVVLVHAFPTIMPNGFIGVDIFFVISGFLISSILLTQLQTASFSLLDFYIRRVNRIFPALILVLVVCLSFGWLALYASEFKELGASTAAGAGFMANVNFYLDVGYWDISSQLKPLLHLWSLGIEEQFYLLWPLLLWAAWTLRLNVVIVCIVIIIASLSWNLVSIGTDQAATFYLPFSRFWELLTGSALACTNMHLKTAGFNASQNTFLQRMLVHRDVLNNVCALLGITLIIVALIEHYPPTEFPGKHAILPVLGAALIIIVGPKAWLNARLLSQRGVAYVGLISFPLYLWHWPLLTFARILEGGKLSVLARNSAVLLAIILAISTYHFLEKPLRASRKGRGLKAIILTALLAICGGYGYFIQAHDGLAARYALPQLPNPLTYTAPKSTSTSKVVLLGDSNAEHFAHGLYPIFKNSLITIAIAGWPHLVGSAYRKDYVPSAKEHVGTPRATEEAFLRITTDPSIDVVVISNMYHYYFTKDLLRSYPNAVPGETTVMAYEAGLRRTVKTLIDAGKQVIVVKSIPVIGVTAVSACVVSGLPIQRRRPKACISLRKDVQKSQESYDLSVKRALGGFPDVAIFDTLAYLCDEQYCYAEKQGVLMYTNSRHLSHAGSDLLGVELAKLIEMKRKTPTAERGLQPVS